MRLLHCGNPPCRRPNTHPKPNPRRPPGKLLTGIRYDGDPVHSVKTLLQDLATVTLNRVTLPAQPKSTFTLVTQTTALQAKMFWMLNIDPASRVAINRAG